MCANCGGADCQCPRAELLPLFDGAKSFYGKASVITCHGTERLLSYNTLVAEYDIVTNTMKVYSIPSRTTFRHVREFLLQHGFNAGTKREISLEYA